MKATVFVTGGSGLLAVNWAAAMRDRCAVTLGLHQRTISLAGVETRKASLESVDDISSVLDEVMPSLVVHTAGLASIEKCEADPKRAQHVNVTLPVNVATACARSGARLIHVSTDQLFGDATSEIVETDPVSPVNVYGRTKAEAESRVLEIHPRALVIRTNFYGWGPSYRRSFSDTIIDALRAGTRLTLFHDVFYSPILMTALAEAAHDLADRNANGIYHVAGDDSTTKHGFGLQLCEQFQLDASLITAGSLKDDPDLVRRPHVMMLDNQKASRALGRKLGGVREHLALLEQQERFGLAREIQSL